jgi:hypothetical protein
VSGNDALYICVFVMSIRRREMPVDVWRMRRSNPMTRAKTRTHYARGACSRGAGWVGQVPSSHTVGLCPSSFLRYTSAGRVCRSRNGNASHIR